MNRRYFGMLPLFASLLALLLIAGCGSDSTTSVTGPGDDPTGLPIWYVDDSATGDGSGRSWENAFVHPSVAMA